MSRWDLTGLMWDDYVAPRVAAVKVKREAPEPTWLADDYLPHYAEASAYVPDEMADADLVEALAAGRRLAWDSEFYPNYALIGFLDAETGKTATFEVSDPDHTFHWCADRLRWIASNFTLLGFNDAAFDVPMLHAALSGLPASELMACVDQLIVGDDGRGMRPYDFYRRRRIKPSFKVDHVDLIQLTPLGPGLKTCAGRIHAPRMADLPFRVGADLSPAQMQVLRWYWRNDLQNTALLFDRHRTAIELREHMTREYEVDVRSKSDPQIAEAVIRKEVERLTGRRAAKAEIVPWRSFRYTPPAYLRYASETMRYVLDFVRAQEFVVDPGGQPIMPPSLDGLDVVIAGSVYRMGIGGLHSQEKRVIHAAGDDHELTDNDVTSYYPGLMIQQGMYPPNVGPEFLHVFRSIVDRRVAAKRAGDKATAETLKIVANGTFGKTGERGGHSVVYYPEMMIQVTVTGQLSLLMLIERLELAGVQVVSANTDGIMVRCRKSSTDVRDAVMRQWEADTGLQLESKAYRAVYARDVNNYVAVYTEPDAKDSSVHRYAKAVGVYRKTVDAYPLKWNPTCEVCSEAVIEFLATGRPVEEAVRACSDVRKFVEVRTVRGGAVKDGEYLGKAIRWYYSTEVEGEIINAKNGHAVPRSVGARPCMVLPNGVPTDLDFDYYVRRALDMIEDFYPKKSEKALAA